MKDKATLEITHFDIAVIEAMHDLMIDEAGYSLDCPALQRARKLTNKMYAALGTTDPAHPGDECSADDEEEDEGFLCLEASEFLYAICTEQCDTCKGFEAKHRRP